MNISILVLSAYFSPISLGFHWYKVIKLAMILKNFNRYPYFDRVIEIFMILMTTLLSIEWLNRSRNFFVNEILFSLAIYISLLLMNVLLIGNISKKEDSELHKLNIFMSVILFSAFGLISPRINNEMLMNFNLIFFATASLLIFSKIYHKYNIKNQENINSYSYLMLAYSSLLFILSLDVFIDKGFVCFFILFFIISIKLINYQCLINNSGKIKTMPKDMRLRVCAHEAGHALVYAMMRKYSSNVNIEISENIGSNSFVGVVRSNISSNDLLSKNEIEMFMLILMAGRISEKLMIGNSSAGCVYDMNKWRDLAVKLLSTKGSGMNYLTDGKFEIDNFAIRRLEKIHESMIVEFLETNKDILTKLSVRLFTKGNMGPNELSKYLNLVNTKCLKIATAEDCFVA